MTAKMSMRLVAVGVKVVSTINVNLYLVFMFVLVADIVRRNCHHYFMNPSSRVEVVTPAELQFC